MSVAGVDLDLRGKVGGFALDAAYTAPARGVTVLFGPSGSGKTTLLRAVAGLEHLHGRLSVSGSVWQDARRFTPPHRRAVGYVFQGASLLSHLTVAGNLDFAARRAGNLVRFARDEVLDLLGLAPLLGRRPERLSGGEAQRVAIARALMRQPDVLLMDEPLTGLDAAAKAEILDYLEALKARAAIPILYVTHDAAEAARLADAVVLIENGRVVAPAGSAAAFTASVNALVDAPPERVARLALAALAAGLSPAGETP